MKAFIYNALGYAKDGAPESVSGLTIADSEFKAKVFATLAFTQDVGTPPSRVKTEEIPTKQLQELLAKLDFADAIAEFPESTDEPSE
jgi:hypothetical protein